MPEILIDDLHTLCQQSFDQTSLTQEYSALAVDHYLYNEICGKSSHGMVRVIEAVNALEKYGAPNEDPKLVHDANNILIFDALGHIGATAVKTSLDVALEKAKNASMTFLGVRNYIGSTGSLTYYLRHIAQHKMIALMGCNSIALVAPPGGRQRQIGTNPLGIAIPSSQENKSLIGDLATSAIAYGKIMVMNETGDSVPEGKMIDQNGNASANPKDAYDGAILPLEGHKGFAIGLMIELLAGPLIGAKAIKSEMYDNDGFFTILINPEKFGSSDVLEQFSNNMNAILETPARPGADAVALSGMRSEKIYQKNIAKGSIHVPEKTLNTLQKLAKGNIS